MAVYEVYSPQKKEHIGSLIGYGDEDILKFTDYIMRKFKGLGYGDMSYAVYGKPIRRIIVFSPSQGDILVDIIEEREIDKDYVTFPNA